MPRATSLHSLRLRADQGPRLALDTGFGIITITVMMTVSIQEMRFDFAKVKSALQRGEEFMLTYRNQPLAKLLPIAQKKSTEPDPAHSFGLISEDIPVMTNQAIDRAIYG